MNDAYKTALSRFLMISVFAATIILCIKFTQLYTTKYVDQITSNYLDSITRGYIALDEYYGFVTSVGTLGYAARLSVDRYDGVYYEHYDLTDINDAAEVQNGLKYFILKDKDFITVTLVRKDITIRESRTMHGSGVFR